MSRLIVVQAFAVTWSAYPSVRCDNPEDAALRFTLQGLKGGHSGLKINEDRGNANKLMIRFVYDAI